MMLNKKIKTLLFLMVFSSVSMSATSSKESNNTWSSQNEEVVEKKKLRSIDDPTVIDTRLGIKVMDSHIGTSGSVGLDDIRKINFSFDEDDNWSLGGSWVFEKFGIINVRGSKGDHNTNYSIGTYIRINDLLDVNTGKWLIFPSTGYNFTTFENSNIDDSHGIYVGAFALRPINTKLNFMSWGFVTKGSDSYSRYSPGLGLSYGITENDRISFIYRYTNDTYEDGESKIGAVYIHRFN